MLSSEIIAQLRDYGTMLNVNFKCLPYSVGMIATTSLSKEEPTAKRRVEEDFEIIENGGFSPQSSIRTLDDDACSEIIRIEQRAVQEETKQTTTMERIVRTLQVLNFPTNL
ncbi:hypothetical protein CHS0354_003090 [Potamilus streckersoni]|uniref:Uncharacterized protein n=1 Tax=Potamilus streckersoni TaxID=2493646 RepID=A0AAE0VHG5_9BIVA|nr:hypothetical protein CHS0354_003090 [Potamilus streckersoni]